jgi:hypothetical protein
MIVDWVDRARRLVAEFRTDIGRHATDQALAGMIADLSQRSEEFRQLWRLQDVVGREGGLRRFQHPAQGALDLIRSRCTWPRAARPQAGDAAAAELSRSGSGWF